MRRPPFSAILLCLVVLGVFVTSMVYDEKMRPGFLRSSHNENKTAETRDSQVNKITPLPVDSAIKQVLEYQAWLEEQEKIKERAAEEKRKQENLPLELMKKFSLRFPSVEFYDRKPDRDGSDYYIYRPNRIAKLYPKYPNCKDAPKENQNCVFNSFLVDRLAKNPKMMDAFSIASDAGLVITLTHTFAITNDAGLKIDINADDDAIIKCLFESCLLQKPKPKKEMKRAGVHPPTAWLAEYLLKNKQH